MKRCILGIIAVVAVFFGRDSLALDTRRISIPSGHSRSEDLGFVPSGFRLHSGKGIVKVNLPAGSSVAVLTAEAGLGTSQIEFPNASGGEGLMLEVEVVSDLDEVLRSLKRELDGFDELEFFKGKSTIRVRGTISNPADWRKYKQILNLVEFRDKVESLVQVGVDAATLGTLRKDLIAEGIPLVDPGVKPQDGQVALDYKYGQRVFSGKVFSASELNNLVRVLKSQSWLQIDDGNGKLVENKVPAVVNVVIDDSILELGVAFVVISKEDIKRRDVEYDLSLSAVWGGIKDFVLGGHKAQRRIHSYSDDFTFNAGLGATLNFFAKNEFSREQQYGTMRFHSNGDFGKTFHVGGTLKVTPPASGEGEAPSSQDFEYGFKIVNKNSHRTGEGSAEADLEIEIKGEPYMPEAAPGAKDLPVGTLSLKQETRTFAPTLRIPLGQTVAVAGYEHLVETTMPPTGIPVLRNIPVISWFTSNKSNVKQEYSLLFLVSIRKVDVEAEAPMVPNSAMKDITLDANTPNEERIKAEEEKAQEHRGCWTPLNWFRW